MEFIYNLPEHITLVPMVQGSQEWLDYRSELITSTDAAVILGQSQRKSRVRLFHEKVGTWKVGDLSDNEFVFWGSIEEKPILNMTQYIDVEGEYIKNYNEGIIQRKLDMNPGILRNSKYEWLMGSLDCIEHDGYKKTSLQPIKLKYIDAKNTTSMALNSYTDGSPREHIIQNNTNMTLGEWDYSELSYKIDGNKLRIFEVPLNKELSEMILDGTYGFQMIVLKGRKIKMERDQYIRDYDMFSAEQAQAELDSLEPEPDGPEDYEVFMKEMYRDRCVKERSATSEELELAHQYKISTAIENVAKQEKQLIKNNLIKIMTSDLLQKLILPKGGITYGTTIRVNMKDTERQIEAGIIAKEIIKTLRK